MKKTLLMIALMSGMSAFGAADDIGKDLSNQHRLAKLSLKEAQGGMLAGSLTQEEKDWKNNFLSSFLSGRLLEIYKKGSRTPPQDIELKKAYKAATLAELNKLSKAYKQGAEYDELAEWDKLSDAYKRGKMSPAQRVEYRELEKLLAELAVYREGSRGAQ